MRKAFRNNISAAFHLKFIVPNGTGRPEAFFYVSGFQEPPGLLSLRPFRPVCPDSCQAVGLELQLNGGLIGLALP